ncbi:hypothetical protein L9F63_003396 [Diploptera punctata]|uniref:Uncharacterized protein n=1 Tax=Diploptera punctata TaxID=6984 RepID=A0AAD8EA39_DIPPU|nr:hypothetical protein L9F63_003396 [Diploptera punctata]
MLVIGFVVIAAIFVFIFYTKKDPAPICGVYKQKGKWYPLKYIVFHAILYLRKFQNSRRKKTSKKQQPGYGVQSHSSISEMDVAQPLSSDMKAFDAVFFIAANKEGYYFIAGTERRQYGIINGLCYLIVCKFICLIINFVCIVPGKGLMCNIKIPDTILFGAEDDEFGAEGLSLKPLSAMKKWKISYKGKMRLQSDPTQVFDVNIEADWFSDLPFFNYDTDLHPSTVARAIAKETWTQEYFNSLKEAHQTHYEQMGVLTANIQINADIFSVKMPSFRDHSYGNRRDWDLMHRYAFFMMFLEDGTKATVGVICQPCTCSRLEAGYVYTPSGKVYPLEWCDFELHRHGENGTPPIDHSFNFKAGPSTYHVQVNVEYQSVHYVGWKWEARMVERFVKYIVNGIPGQGVSEFHYHNNTGRPSSISEKDPDWFKKLSLR